jgi:hypothetical protein
MTGYIRRKGAISALLSMFSIATSAKTACVLIIQIFRDDCFTVDHLGKQQTIILGSRLKPTGPRSVDGY